MLYWLSDIIPCDDDIRIQESNKGSVMQFETSNLNVSDLIFLFAAGHHSDLVDIELIPIASEKHHN